MNNSIISNRDSQILVDEIIAEVVKTDIPPAIAAAILTDISTMLQEAAIKMASIEEQGHSVN